MATREHLLALAERYGLSLDGGLLEELEGLVSSGGSAASAGVSTAGYDTWYAEAPTQSVPAASPAHPRYELLDELGSGGMGEVFRARDAVLLRTVALKRAARAVSSNHRSRFAQEAQATAQLEHPGIVPIYDFGTFDDGTLYYTMPVVRGRTLGELIALVHGASSEEEWHDAEDGTNFRRLVVSFLTVCEAMAYAHDRGVIHRDLKPDNIMVGAYGQTLVVDWGLAKVLGSGPEEVPTEESVRTSRSSSSDNTVWGTVTGTPQYMPPEQARGAVDALSPASDVWSLGAILYELLAGVPPHGGATKIEVIASVIARTPQPVDSRTERPLPSELVSLVEACVQKNPADRPKNAGFLADEVRAWLDGERRREHALVLMGQADALLPMLSAAREKGVQLERQSKVLLAALEPWRPVEDKLPGWELLDQAAEVRAQADRVEQERLQLLRQALRLVPDLEPAHRALADYYRARHEGTADPRLRAELEGLLRTHDRGAHARYLEGTGSLTLRTVPPDAAVVVRPYLTHERRLVPGTPSFEGRAPIAELDLPAGSYRVELSADGRESVVYPVRIERARAFEPRGADGASVDPIRLPLAGAVGPEERFVPAGWTLFGGDDEAHSSLPQRRVWVDSFAMERTPVTVAKWLDFLSDLRAKVDPRFDRFRPEPEVWSFEEGPDGQLLPGLDPEGFRWLPDMPMSFVSYEAAHAYAEWRSEREGLLWRLPSETEWEKAARGVDGRLFPWGSFYDPTWCAAQGSAPGGPEPRPVGSHPVDCSPYGVHDMCGAIIEWTSTVYKSDGPVFENGREVPSDPTPTTGGAGRRCGRGAAFYNSTALARIGTRMMLTESRASLDIGVRLVRSV